MNVKRRVIMKYEIKRCYTGFVIYSCIAETLAECIHKAFREGVSLYGADLSGLDFQEIKILHALDLRYADLQGSNMAGCDLRYSDLFKANMKNVILHDANLHGANLKGACLCGADLRVCDLSGADMHGADLRGANMQLADIRGANMRDVLID